MKVYYAHSMRIYNTEREAEELEYLHKTYGEENVINPANLRYGNDMPAYFREISECDKVISSTYLGYIGRGVYTEIEHAQDEPLPVTVLRGSKKHGFREVNVEGVETFDRNDWSVAYGVLITEDDQ